MSVITDEIAQKRLEFLQAEYWRLRNGKQRYMRCPYCETQENMRRNFPHQDKMCCRMFAKALSAILDRQDEVDKALFAVKVMNMAGGTIH